MNIDDEAEQTLERKLSFSKDKEKKTKLECIKFARENFITSEMTQSELNELNEVMFLLVADSVSIKKYSLKTLSYLLSDDRWNDLEVDIKNSFFNIYSMKPFSSLEILFQCGLMSLKTSHCGKIKEWVSNCPTCQDDILTISKGLPYSQLPNSSLLCRKTKNVMDHNNQPLATKNGYLFSTNYVNSQIKTNGIFKCLEEDKVYKSEDMKKVFLV